MAVHQDRATDTTTTCPVCSPYRKIEIGFSNLRPRLRRGRPAAVPQRERVAGVLGNSLDIDQSLAQLSGSEGGYDSSKVLVEYIARDVREAIRATGSCSSKV